MGQYDIEPQNISVMKFNALNLSNLHAGAADFIITNPPWIRTKKSGYLLHNLIEVFANLRPTWLLIDSDWHETKQATTLLTEYCEKIVSIGRVKWFGNMTGKDNCSWYLFDKNKTGHIEFVPRI